MFTLTSAIFAEIATDLPNATHDKLPRWRGFNLLEKFHKEWSNGPFREEDFRLISELGFNFVRLPMDYRIWIKEDDWTKFDEKVFAEIDQAIAYGEKYNIHVCINFHRAPGYSVASPKEATDLWTDDETQKICAKHWAFFARRYKGIPNDRLSFNLFNEPSLIDSETHLKVVRKIVQAIRAEDPDRLIIADGRMWGGMPCRELIELKIAQSTRGYAPMPITHHQASWIPNGDQMATPTSWPLPLQIHSYFYGTQKSELQSPLKINGNFDQPIRLRIRIGTVSGHGKLIMKCDGEIVWEKSFVCDGGEGEWQEAIFKSEWGIYQNRFDRDYFVDLPIGTKEIELSNVEGDWLTITEIGFHDGSTEHVLKLIAIWGGKHESVKVDQIASGWKFETPTAYDRDWLWENYIEPWREIESRGVGVMVGEWGAFNKTPHDVVLRWMEDCLKNWQRANWGWALWNFRGSFGILDSDRADVEYELWRDHQLDRKMLELLQKY